MPTCSGLPFQAARCSVEHMRGSDRTTAEPSDPGATVVSPLTVVAGPKSDRRDCESDAHVAQCIVFSHQFGWELRLEVGELFTTQVYRSDREIEEVAAGWRDAMLAKGWAGAD